MTATASPANVSHMSLLHTPWTQWLQGLPLAAARQRRLHMAMARARSSIACLELPYLYDVAVRTETALLPIYHYLYRIAPCTPTMPPHAAADAVPYGLLVLERPHEVFVFTFHLASSQRPMLLKA